jgi:hypothetical protein
MAISRFGAMGRLAMVAEMPEPQTVRDNLTARVSHTPRTVRLRTPGPFPTPPRRGPGVRYHFRV